MFKKKLEVITSNYFLCKGQNKNHNYSATGIGVPVIVVIFKDGHSDVLCPNCKKEYEFWCEAYSSTSLDICPYGLKRKI